MSEQLDAIQCAVLSFDAVQAGVRRGLLAGVRNIAERTDWFRNRRRNEER